MGAQVLVEHLAHPAPLVGARHAVTPEQLALPLERQPADLPADREALEQELAAALPAVLGAGGRLRLERVELRPRAGAQFVAQRQDVALGIGVVGGGARRRRAL